ncbi:MAG: FAD-binding protein [Candidatus Limiplasma sp.]|nr:FAD-binding protein [Candidatus Limiplasma sp.]
MRETTITLGAFTLPVYSLNTVVVGTGAAGYNAADRLFQYGQRDIAMVTEHVLAGTSRNTGSDKQTYYKLTLSGGDGDSVREMAQTLFAGQCMDGDHALCEAALSAQGFLRLVELGVPFPRNRFGEFIGYKTDHDPRRRATSVGPYTSKRMTECLQASVEAKNIRVFDKMQVVRVLSDGKRVQGLLCLDLEKEEEYREAFVLFCCQNVVYATGGPAGMYADSVYPFGHFGATGLAFEAGVKGKNLTEWQYGLASVRPRWNVSGTYMQVLPRFISTDRQGGDEREFLFDFFHSKGDLLSKVFLKGYQWPFDVRKVAEGSSIIDLLVYRESGKGRKVYLDFRQNPRGEEVDFQSLSQEARAYLERAGACFGTPVERLAHMNAPAVAFYKDKGVDLRKEPLEIALCTQHNNGGLDIDCWWQTNMEGFFAVGEAAASHGVYRPGGSALNAGQVGGARAAQYIAAQRRDQAAQEDAFAPAVISQVEELLQWVRELWDETQDNVKPLWDEATARMSNIGGAIRNAEGIREGILQTRRLLEAFSRTVRIHPSHGGSLHRALRLRDVLLCQEVYLSAMADYVEHGGKSRGSALYTDPQGEKPDPGLPDIFRFSLDDGSRGNLVQEALWGKEASTFAWRTVRPIPQDDDFFENVWREFREHGNVY